MLQSTSSLRFVSAHLEGGGSGCVNLMQHSLLKKAIRPCFSISIEALHLEGIAGFYS